VGVLGLLGGGVDLRLGGKEVLAVDLSDEGARLGHGLAGHADGVGAHVGDQPHGAFLAELDALVELLGDHHGLLGREAEPARGLLLELARREGGQRVALRLLALDGAHREGRCLEPLDQFPGLGVACDLGLLPRDLDEPGLEGRRVGPLEGRRDRPVLLGREVADLLLALADDPHGDGLDAAGREPPLDLVPEDRADLVAHQPVEDAPGLLGLVAVAVQGQGVADRREHRVLRQVVEQHPVDRLPLRGDLLGDVPGDGLALAVGVRGEVDRVGRPGGLLELGDDLLLRLEDLVGGAEVVLDVDPERVAGQVLHVAHGGPDVELRAEVFLDGLHLRGRLDDDQCVRHQGSFRENRFPGSCRM